MGLGVALKRAFVNSSELPACAIRALLLADVLADLLQFESDRGNGIASGPEMFTREIPLLAAQSGNRNRTLPFQKPDHRSHRVLGGNRDAHMYMVWHQMPFENLAFLLPRQRVEDRTQLPARLSENRFPTPLGHEPRGTCSPIWNGIGSGKALTLNPPHRWSSSHLRGILLLERSNLFKSHWSNQWLTNFSYTGAGIMIGQISRLLVQLDHLRLAGHSHERSDPLRQLRSDVACCSRAATRAIAIRIRRA